MRNGENIRLRKDGRYEARYFRSRDENGHIVYGYVYGKTIEEVQKKRDFILSSDKKKPQMNLLILGSGTYGLEVEEIAQKLRIFQKIAFLDDNPKNERTIGKIKDMNFFKEEYPIAFPAIANDDLRKQWMSDLEMHGFIIPTLVHPNAVIAQDTIIEAGSVICAEAVISIGAKIEKGCFISSGATIKRNSKVHSFSFVDYGVII